MQLRKLAFNILALGLVAAPLTLALAGLSGVGHRWVDILAQFTAPALAATVLLGLGFVLIRRWRWTGATAVTGVLLFAAVWPQWFPPGERAETGAPVIRVYSANLYYRNDDAARIRRSIVAADPDIVVLIELARRPAAHIDELLAGYPHRVVSVRLDDKRRLSRSLVASRYPLTGLRDRPDGLHDVVAVARTPLGRLNIVGVHLTRPWPFQEQWGQIEQSAALAAVRADLTGPVIVAGDFNSVSNARIGRQVQRETGLIPAPGFPGTWPSDLPAVFGMTIDQVYRSPDLAVVSRRLGQPTGSDHRPVITEFTRAAN